MYRISGARLRASFLALSLLPRVGASQSVPATLKPYPLWNFGEDGPWKTSTTPWLESLKEPCDGTSEDCWNRFLKKHGRGFVQRQWLAAWNKSKDQIYGDEKARCFRVSSQSKPK
jgi:hypothetical protein